MRTNDMVSDLVKVLNSQIWSWTFLSVLLQIAALSTIKGQDISYSLGTRDVMVNDANVPVFPWFPDGHIPVLIEPDGSNYVMYWSEFENYRTFGEAPYPEYQLTLSPEEPVFGGRRDVERWDNGGSWLMSVFRQAGDSLVGFYHAEDHWDRQTNAEGIAWKSVARSTSSDNGETWSEGEQILTSSATRPDIPTWGGVGDNCVIWDSENMRWLCYYQEHWLMMAVSYDVNGRPGTWQKYYNGEFDQPGLGGENSPIPGLKSVPGGNPSVHYNYYLERYVMVWHSWVTTSIYISTSTDGVDWEEPVLLEPNSESRRAWYPTIIGESNIEAGRIARLYYADIAPGFTSREFVSKALVFDKQDSYQSQATWQNQELGEVPVLGHLDVTDGAKFRMIAFSGSVEGSENFEYYFQDRQGSYLVSGKFSLDEMYNEGSVGLCIRSGLGDADAMATIVLSKDSLSISSRRKDGDVSIERGNSIEWTSGNVWLQIEKGPETVTCRYSSSGTDWADLQSVAFDHGETKAGIFATASPENVTVAYVEYPDSMTALGSVEDSDNIGFSNPAGDYIVITNPEEYTNFMIWGLNGRLQMSGAINSNQVDVQRLNPGMYILGLYNNEFKAPIVGKLIITR